MPAKRTVRKSKVRKVKIVQISDLVGKSLKQFKLVKMTEVFKVDAGDQKVDSLVFFKSPTTASAYAASHKDERWLRTKLVVVLTNGVIGFVLETQTPAQLYNHQIGALLTGKNVFGDLTPDIREVFGL